ncbi:MAG: hypothetical protein O7E51_13610, partial [Acidobacteria bacterium]|nr:hypothetical protein [Acidobacteriota bacterium]
GSDIQEEYIGDNQNLRLNIIPGGNNNPVLDTRDAFNYYDLSQVLPSVCRGAAYCYDSNGDPIPELGYATGFFGNAGRGTLTTPGDATLDFSIQKSFNVSENHRIRFSADFFNLFNRVNLGNPDSTPYDGDGALDTDLFSPTGGQITSAGDSRRIQFGLKYTF